MLSLLIQSMNAIIHEFENLIFLIDCLLCKLIGHFILLFEIQYKIINKHFLD